MTERLRHLKNLQISLTSLIKYEEAGMAEIIQSHPQMHPIHGFTRPHTVETYKTGSNVVTTQGRNR